ncbi:MAG: hypothetical protein GX345_07745 [Clostridiales bacterium]|nr:hypothetical protein [Clostridiales bacterium]
MSKLKSTLSIFLILVLLFVPLGSLNASASVSCNCGKAPIIFVNGMNSIPLTRNLGMEDQEQLFPPSEQIFAKAIGEAALPLASKFLTQGLDGAADVIVDAVGQIFDGLACEDNGDLPYGQGVDWAFPQIHMPHNDEYTFYYDWRQDPFISAAQLAEYVDYVKANTGHDKVSLIGFSMGGIVLNTYLYTLNGDYSSLQSVLMEVSAANGAAIAAEPFSGKVKLDSKALVRLIDDQFRLRDSIEGLLGAALGILDESGLFELPFRYLNGLIDQYADKVYDEVLAEIFGSMPGVWAAVTDEHYEAAKAKLLPDKVRYAKLIERIDNYHDNVLKNSNRIALDLYNNPDVNFAVLCKYNRQVAPLIDSMDISSDGTVDTLSASYGATCADLGKTLGKDYLQALPHDGQNYLSADNLIDASTCTVADATWFIRDLEHSTFCNYRNELIDYILSSQEQVSVFDREDFPQFAYYDGNDAFPINEKSETDPFDVLKQLGLSDAYFALITRTLILLSNLT